jgi:hypothetical protein
MSEDTKGAAPPTWNPKRGLLYDPEQDDIVLNRWHLKDLLEKMEREKARPNLRDAAPALTILLTLLLALVPGNFGDFLGIEASTWEVLAILVAGGAALRIAQICIAVGQTRDQRLTAADVLQELEADFKERIAKAEQQQLGQPGDATKAAERGQSGGAVPQSVPETTPPLEQVGR